VKKTMTNSVVVYFPNGKEIEITVGKGGVKKIFTDKDSNEQNLVVLHEDGITVYSGLPFICEKDYKDAK